MSADLSVEADTGWWMRASPTAAPRSTETMGGSPDSVASAAAAGNMVVDLSVGTARRRDSPAATTVAAITAALSCALLLGACVNLAERQSGDSSGVATGSGLHRMPSVHFGSSYRQLAVRT